MTPYLDNTVLLYIFIPNMAGRKKFKEALVDFPPSAVKEKVCPRQMKWPESLYQDLYALKGEASITQLVIGVMRDWVKKQEKDE